MNEEEFKRRYVPGSIQPPPSLLGTFLFVVACALIYLTMEYGKEYPTLILTSWYIFTGLLLLIALRILINGIKLIWWTIQDFFNFLRNPFK